MEVLKCLSDILNIFNKPKNPNDDINENDKIKYMFKALPKELHFAFLPNPGKTAKIIMILSNLEIYLSST